jgi:hypothetical protein
MPGPAIRASGIDLEESVPMIFAVYETKRAHAWPEKSIGTPGVHIITACNTQLHVTVSELASVQLPTCHTIRAQKMMASD